MVKILLIEDDATVRAVLRDTLAQFGHGVTEARNGKEGLALLAIAAPQCWAATSQGAAVAAEQATIRSGFRRPGGVLYGDCAEFAEERFPGIPGQLCAR